VSCSECSGGGKSDCLKCSPNFYHLNEQCLMECPDGYYKDDSSSICAQCSQVCLTCTSGSFWFIFIVVFLKKKIVESICSSCISKYSLYGGELSRWI